MSSNPDLSEPADDQPAQSDDQPADDQPAQSDDQPADDQPSQSDDQPADDQPAQSDDKPADDSDGQGSKSDEKPAEDSDKPAQPSDDKPVDGGTGSGQLNAKRQDMIDLTSKWMPTSLLNPRADGKSVKPGQDLMAKAGWDKARGQQSKADKDAGKGVTTSCGDILHAMLVLWKSNFLGWFNIRDSAAGGPGAKARGFYVERDQLVLEDDVVKTPKPGDIIVLRNGVGKAATGVGHVGILVEAGKTEWRTADGGGGQLPDQTAEVTVRTVTWTNGVPIMKSPTDKEPKELDGWIDLDQLDQTG
jgi:hypothetical protein